ncbi:MAG TPA: exo-alpha-sialidase [Dehalococcoidia bacterium]|nr:exo-alpha-sialidase [Dehalococcoidia bacterium]
MTRVVLTVGTKKGLFVLESDQQRSSWQQTGPFLNGNDINHTIVDPRTGVIFATANDPWFGNRVSRSKDRGETWQDSSAPPKFAEGSERTVEKLWRIQPGLPSEPEVVYCGVDPACLFRSNDGGDTWVENVALSTHPTRDRWFPGAGGLITHSIVLDPTNRNRMWVAISAAGVFRSEDGANSWQSVNSSLKNILAKYEPNAEKYPEVGQCVHHLVHAAGNGDRLYAQTHWGTYRSDDGASTWTEITEGLPSDFGMQIAAHPTNPDVAYVLPLQGAEFRCPPEAKLRVYRTSDAGKSWQALTRGLPQENAYMGTYREGMSVDSLSPAGIYFGTNTGQLFASADEGETWSRITPDLPPISSVSAAVID